MHIRIQAGICDKQLTFALEPEAAALYCKSLPEDKLSGSLLDCFQPGGRYMVLDLGGGTVDTVVHGVKNDGCTVEIHKACGGSWGGTQVDSEFINYIGKALGESVVPHLKQICAIDWVKMEKEFETRKRKVDYSSDKPVRLVIPPKILVNSNIEVSHLNSFMNMKVEHDILRSFFKPSVEHIAQHIKDILEVVPDIHLIFMVGGYSESNYVSQYLREKIPQVKFIVPFNAGVSVLEGAVRFGFNPQSVAARVCRLTYGCRCVDDFDESVHLKKYRRAVDKEDTCINIFKLFAEEGETIGFDEKKAFNFFSSHKQSNRKKLTLELRVYASKSKRPKYTTDDGCVEVGVIKIHPPESGWPDNVDFNVKAYFGRTEFSVEVNDETNNQNYKATFDFLDKIK